MKTKTDSLTQESPSMPVGRDNRCDALLTCDAIQILLFAYMTRELGDVQSKMVREHLRSCERCREEAADIETAMDALRTESVEHAGGNARLSDERRARILRAVFHPVMDWIHCHHRLVSYVAAVLFIIFVLFALRGAAILREQQLEEGIPIWRMFRSGRLPELVEKERLRRAAEKNVAGDPGVDAP